MTRHRFDPFSFLAGLVCTVVAIVALVDPSGIELADLRIIGPGTVLLLGIALLVGGGRRDQPVATRSGPAAPDPDPDTTDDAVWSETERDEDGTDQ